MVNRDLPECARNYLTDAYAKVRHYGGKFDEMMQKAAVGYQAAVPLVAAAADAYGTPEQKQALRTTKKVLDRGLMNYAKGRLIGEVAAKHAESLLT